MSPRDPVLRLVRAAVFAMVCVAVSAGGHLFAGGARITATPLLLGAGAALALAWTLNGRERSRETVLAATAGTQIVLHELFTDAPDPIAEHGHLNLGMPLVHLTVALLTGWWLHRGERAAWAILRLWAAEPFRLLLIAKPPEPPEPVRPAVPRDDAGVHRSRHFTTAVARRGPPVLLRAG
ncbi:MFS transporter [Nonomuraea typhae]|uniref:MFS transporter n=1 Tax=Nonomuraea typhae TaxID=2603600 RepID=A0ABW7YN46_9ACTN